MKIINGDSLEVLKREKENSVDSIVTDPPYGLSFMGKKWDYDVPSRELWEQALRVLKPGGHLLSFAGSRTYHRMAVNIEDAGFEIRDQIMWVYGSGFPKSHNIGKAVDKLQGNERVIVREEKEPIKPGGNVNWDMRSSSSRELTKGNSPYEGWGTALKPAHEPIVVARKPLSEKTIAKNVLEWGTGGINIDGCRVEANDGQNRSRDNSKCKAGDSFFEGKKRVNQVIPEQLGRFPANFIHDGSDEVVELFPETKTGTIKPYKHSNRKNTCYGEQPEYVTFDREGDSGSAARFFYCAKASKKDRNEGLEDFEEKARPTMGSGIGGQPDQQKANNRNVHPTVKPTQLMQYLVRLVTPKGGIVLDPFMGSGSTGKACKLEGFDFIGIDLDPEYCKIAQARIDNIKL